MKIYRLVDNAMESRVHTDLASLCKDLLKVMKKYEDRQSWFWVDEEEI